MTSGKKVITITGGNGFVGNVLKTGLQNRGYKIDIFDPMKGLLLNVLRRRYLGTSQSKISQSLAPSIRRIALAVERRLLKYRVIHPSPDDILDTRDHLVERFRNSYAIIHLAALPHPKVPGMTPDDYRRINYEGSVNVFESARKAGVKKFIFASSAQIYNINNPAHIEQFPILETNYLPTVAEGQSHYGFLKGEFERYMAKNCTDHNMQAVALRLEFPGVRSLYPWNLYISTSVENTLNGFIRALEKDMPSGFDAFNLADRYVDPGIADIQKFLKNEWPQIPNHTTGNECLMSTEKATSLLGYTPKTGGTYYSFNIMW
jgi:nucleoside-diphosphate-sugar epimerase